MILQNGKRIDGCSDTVPVGTLQPYLGLVPPKGYLLCQGQLVSKTTYSKLYEICGNLFGEGTDTEFRLPDLRGKTIVGFDEGDTLLNVIGEILGSKTHTHTSAEHSHTIEGHTHTSAAHTHTVAGHTHTSAAHTHTTGNHTLTVAEIPAHSHAMYGGASTGGTQEGTDSFASGFSSFRKIEQGTYDTGGSGAHNHGNTGSTTPGNTGSTSLTTDSTTPGNTGSTTLTTNNTKPGDTGEADNYQPSIVMNWIVKAVMLIPEYFVVENTLNSDSEDNALSAKQGKLLNEKFVDYATKSEMIQYLPLSGGTLTGPLILSGSGMETHDPAGVRMDIYGNLKHKRENDADTWGISNYTEDKVLIYTFGTGKLQVPGELYSEGKKIARFKASTPEFDATYASGAWFRVHENGGNMLMVGGGLQILQEVPSRTPFITIPGVNSSYSSFQYSLIATGSNDVGFRLRAYNSGNNIVIDNEDCNLPVGWYNVTGFIYLRD